MRDDWRSALGRWRPFLALAVAILLTALVPAGNDDGGPDEAVASARRPAADVAQDEGPAAVALDGPAMASVDPARNPGAGRTAEGGTSGAPAVTAAPPPATGAGIGTAAALAAPDCDPATKRIRVYLLRAPACVVPWPAGADNGGATAPGVTGTTIKIVIYNPPADPTNPIFRPQSREDLLAAWKHAAAPFERFFRQWGRKVEWVVFDASGTDEVAQRADAIQMANMKPFAVDFVQPSQTVLISELASRRIVVVTGAGLSQQLAAKVAPFAWGINVPPGELCLLSAANYAGKRLLGRPARWAGQADYQAQSRRFGLVYSSDLDPGAFENEFARHRGTLTDRQVYPFGTGNAAQWQESARTMVARMKSKGVTTVVAGADLVFLPTLTKEATAQQWFPEWVLTGLLGQDIDLIAKTNDQLQWRHAFGPGALVAGNSMVVGEQYRFEDWYWGETPDPAPGIAGFAEDHTAFIYLGLHGAGPSLTSQTFRDGMFSLPPSGGAFVGGIVTYGYSFGRWGVFPSDDYNAFDDFTEIWWDASGQGRDNLVGQDQVGVYRYMNGGKRYFYDQWPTGEPNAFSMEGVAPYYTDYPAEADKPPPYACTGCPSQRA